MIHSVSRSNTKLFCEQYWTKAHQNVQPRKANVNLPFLFDITDINQMLVGCDIPMYYWLQESLKPSLNKMIKYIDIAFKMLPPTKDKLILWRGIKEPSGSYERKRMERFNSRFNAKAGDIIYMPEYAFTSDDIRFSKVFSTSPNVKRATLYEIEAPTGSKISQSYHYIFPRGSKFECLDNTEMIENEQVYHIVKLRYLKPENNNPQVADFFSNFFKS